MSLLQSALERRHCLFLLAQTDSKIGAFMIVFVTSAISVLMLAVACYQMFRDGNVPDKPKDRIPAVLLVAAALTLCIGCITGSMTVEALMADLVPASAGMLVLTSSLFDRKDLRPVLMVLAGFYAIPVFLHIAVASGWVKMLSVKLLLPVYIALAFMPVGFFIAGIARRLRNIKIILKTGTVWANVSLAVDAVYVVLFLSLYAGYVVSHLVCPEDMRVCLLIFPCMQGLLLAALGVRDADDMLFVLWRGQERRIVESMKVTKVETAMDPSGIDDVYQDIYERVVAYFEAEKPFLDSDLTMNDLVKILYSNKLYISRAISQFTGRNFCQFVNYYRVVYSMELFRNNHDLKIHELACGSGFNSDVSYNMAFRLFMGETPGEWCRKERNRRIKMKK